MSDEKDENSGRGALVFGVGVTVAVMGLVFAWMHFRGPDGAHDAWLAKDSVLVEEFRDSEDGSYPRFVLHEPKTGKRLTDRGPGDLEPMFVVNGRLWLRGTRDYGLEAWSIKDLSTLLSVKELGGVKLSDSNVCTDGRFARMSLVDGHYVVVDLYEAKTVREREVRCSSPSRPSPLTSSSGDLRTERDGNSQRQRLTFASAPLGGDATFLEPQLAAGEDGLPLSVEGDFFLVHRVQLGEDRRLQVTRIGAKATKWTVGLGTSTQIQRVLLAAPSTLIVVGRDGITTLDAATGKVLWRTGS